ncbi:response regulator [Desulforhopalus sp. IMCC35007]|uniref:response regulator n=1 Tax=Desulforhopalus sp. IMCC35007 TaxID=2569543 RepID=UPI0010AE3338|nr:response regulator [Desulforhopalus sp. IMCC35007]TKB10393.1 response regulator [Desulforhopalus sp. IMCC35007]
MDKELHAKVLLVDDEEDFTDALSKRLEARNLKVKTVNRGEDAVQMVDEHSFDVIILDLSMPGMDGLETLQRIKENHPDAEIIILTGHASVQSSVKAMKIGAEDLLEKPVDITALLHKIEEAHKKRVVILQKQSKKEIENIIKSRGW